MKPSDNRLNLDPQSNSCALFRLRPSEREEDIKVDNKSTPIKEDFLIVCKLEKQRLVVLVVVVKMLVVVIVE